MQGTFENSKIQGAATATIHSHLQVLAIDLIEV